MNNRGNKRILFILIPLLGLSVAAFVAASQHAVGFSAGVDGSQTGLKHSTMLQNEKHEAPEPAQSVVKAALRFIVNCNPFKK